MKSPGGLPGLLFVVDACFVVSLNLNRRQLTSSQRSALIPAIKKRLAEEAKARQIEAGKHGAEGGRGNKKEETLIQQTGEGFTEPPPKPAKTTDELAAEITGTNKTYAHAISVIEEKAPEKVQDIRDGKVSTSNRRRFRWRRDAEVARG